MSEENTLFVCDHACPDCIVWDCPHAYQHVPITVYLNGLNRGNCTGEQNGTAYCDANGRPARVRCVAVARQDGGGAGMNERTALNESDHEG